MLCVVRAESLRRDEWPLEMGTEHRRMSLREVGDVGEVGEGAIETVGNERDKGARGAVSAMHCDSLLHGGGSVVEAVAATTVAMQFDEPGCQVCVSEVGGGCGAGDVSPRVAAPDCGDDAAGDRQPAIGSNAVDIDQRGAVQHFVGFAGHEKNRSVVSCVDFAPSLWSRSS